MDINCGTYLLRHTKSALKQGKVSEQDIDRALFNLFSVQLRLGLFDGNPGKGKFGKLGPRDVCTEEHRALALEAARQGIVLLKNENNFLPLNKNTVSSLAVIGPMANDTGDLGGDYTGMLPYVVSRFIPCINGTYLLEIKILFQFSILFYGETGKGTRFSWMAFVITYLSSVRTCHWMDLSIGKMKKLEKFSISMQVSFVYSSPKMTFYH